MLISTASPSWDEEARQIEEVLKNEGITIIEIIPMNHFNGVDFICIGEDKKTK